MAVSVESRHSTRMTGDIERSLDIQEATGDIKAHLVAAGAAAVGFSKGGEISPQAASQYRNWISEDNHGDMNYLERHIPLRQHTDNVLKGTKTVISLAFSYYPNEWRSLELPMISAYAYNRDYHLELRERLQSVVKEFQEKYGGKWRICIDSAPVAERYWACKSGIGKRGLNGSVIVEKCGGVCFLVEILTTIELVTEEYEPKFCDKCGKCKSVCPGKAINGDGTIDARRCVNYLTIEKKGDFTEEEIKILRNGAGFILGCDRCLRVCPHNRGLGPQMSKSTGLNILHNHSDVFSKKVFTADDLDFFLSLKETAFEYTGRERLLRNLSLLKND